MAYSCIEVERRGHVMMIRLARPEVMNALSPAASAECAEVLDAFAADPDARVAIITGSGEKAFCTGSDLREQKLGAPRPASGFGGMTERHDLMKPVIAAVNGLALGGGFELALACDIIVAADHAQFALPEPKLGIAALAGGLHRLPRAIGEKRALGIILTARRVTAEEGEALGFVHQVVPVADLADVAWRLAEDIAALSPVALRAAKQAMLRGLEEPTIRAAMAAQIDCPEVKAMLASDDRREGARAFREKRTPAWT
jgi:crotonobetainyl-CoA hydratase